MQFIIGVVLFVVVVGLVDRRLPWSLQGRQGVSE